MKRRSSGWTALLLALAFQPAPAGAQGVVTVPPDGAKVHLTLPQTGPALVRDRRIVTLPGGRCLVRLTGVAARLLPETVQPVLTGPAPAQVLEQRFRYDLGSREKLLRQYVGQTVTLIPHQGASVSGTLLSAEETVLLETGSGVLVNPEGTFSVPRLPAGAALPPTLEWVIEVPRAGEYAVEARYAATGLAWTATYQVALNTQGDRLALNGWLVAANDSGADFRGAQLSFQPGAAGDLTPPIPYPRPVDLPHGERRQLSYVSISDRPAAPELVFFAAEAQPNYTAPHTASPQVTLRLRNDTTSGLGLPLPAGLLTVLGAGVDGSLRQLAHRPIAALAPNGRLWVALRPAEGVTAARSHVAQRQLNPLTDEHTLQIALTNTRAEEVTVLVIERLPPGARITESSVPPAPAEDNLTEFRVTVPPNGTGAVKYVVELKK